MLQDPGVIAKVSERGVTPSVCNIPKEKEGCRGTRDVLIGEVRGEEGQRVQQSVKTGLTGSIDRQLLKGHQLPSKGCARQLRGTGRGAAAASLRSAAAATSLRSAAAAASWWWCRAVPAPTTRRRQRSSKGSKVEGFSRRHPACAGALASFVVPSIP